MPDAIIRIDGRLAGEPRYNTTKDGQAVANLRVLAGRSKRNDDGTWTTLSTTAFDVSFWDAHHDLVAHLGPVKGDQVVVDGTLLGVDQFDGQNGPVLSCKVRGSGLQVWRKEPRQARPSPQGEQWNSSDDTPPF